MKKIKNLLLLIALMVVSTVKAQDFQLPAYSRTMVSLADDALNADVETATLNHYYRLNRMVRDQNRFVISQRATQIGITESVLVKSDKGLDLLQFIMNQRRVNRMSQQEAFIYKIELRDLSSIILEDNTGAQKAQVSQQVEREFQRIIERLES